MKTNESREAASREQSSDRPSTAPSVSLLRMPAFELSGTQGKVTVRSNMWIVGNGSLRRRGPKRRSASGSFATEGSAGNQMQRSFFALSRTETRL